jgi:hypothetical protein
MILGVLKPSLYALTDWRNRLPRIRPRGLFWSIPACIETMLCYAGLDGISQEDLVLGYCRNYGEGALLEIVLHAPLRTVPASIKGLDQQEIIELAKQCTFRCGNFDTFAEAARRKLAFKRPPMSLDFIGGIKARADYFAAMTEAVKADCPIAISVKARNHTLHNLVVLEADPDKFITYDPERNTIRRRKVADCDFSGDALVLRPDS